MCKKILILDDEPDMALTIAEMLDFVSSDFKYCIAKDVYEALDLINDEHFDCIISDVHLPGVDGLTLIAKLREAGNTTPVIITSGRSDQALKDKILQVGGFDFLAKPFDIAQVGDAVLASFVKAS